MSDYEKLVDEFQKTLREGITEEVESEELINNLKKLICKNGITNEPQFGSILYRKSESIQNNGLWIASAGFGIAVCPFAILPFIPFGYALSVGITGFGVFISGVLFSMSGGILGNIASEHFVECNQMVIHGSYKIPFDKVWFEYWNNVDNIPKFRTFLLIEAIAFLLSVLSLVGCVLIHS